MRESVVLHRFRRGEPALIILLHDAEPKPVSPA